MYTKTLFAAGALLSLAAAVPLQQQNKRDIIYETKTFEEVVTVDVTTTVWLEPGETPPSHYGHGHNKPKVTSTIRQPVTVPASPSSPPEQSPESPYVPPNPSTPEAPTTSAYVPPTTQAPPPAPKPTKNPGGGSGAPSGDTHTGEATYYAPGLGSCGLTNSESDSIVALAAGMMEASLPPSGNPNDNPLCGSSITISYNGKTATATIVDTCPGCEDAGLDMTPSLFQQFAPLSEGRLFGVEWWYN